VSGKATRNLPGEDGSDAERTALENKHAKRIYAAFQAVLLKVAPTNTTVRNVTVDKAIERWRSSRDIIRDALVDMLTDSVLLGADVGRQQVEAILGVGKAPVVVGGVDWDMINVNVLQWVTGGGQMGGGLGGGYANALAETMSATTETGLRTIFGEWINNNLSYGQLVQQLDRTVFGRTRSEMVATTEITRAYAQGTLESYRGSRVVKRIRWQAVGDERVCPQCGPLNQTVALISEGFPGGVMPPRHVRCRCWISGVVDIADFEQTQPEQPLPPVGQFASLDQAAQWASRSYPNITWDFDGAHINTINPTLAQFDKLAQKYPDVAKRLEYVGTYRGKTPPFTNQQSDQFGNAIAHAYYESGKQIGLNPRYYGDPVGFSDALEQMKSGKWVDADNSIESILSHEFGHLVDGWLKASNKAWNDTVSLDGFGLVSETLEIWRGSNRATKALSEYATANTLENFAEAFAALQHKGGSRSAFVKKFETMLDAIANPAVWTDNYTYTSDMPRGEERDQARARITELRKMLNIK